MKNDSTCVAIEKPVRFRRRFSIRLATPRQSEIGAINARFAHPSYPDAR